MTAVLNFILLNITSCSSSRTVEEAVSRKIKSSFFTFLCVEMKAAALLKRQIYRLQFLHRNVKLDVLNGAHQLLPAIVFRAWCFSTLLSFSPLKAGEWWTWAGDGATFGNLRSVSAQFVTSGAKHWDWWDVETTARSIDAPNERWDVCRCYLLRSVKSRMTYVPDIRSKQFTELSYYDFYSAKVLCYNIEVCHFE